MNPKLIRAILTAIIVIEICLPLFHLAVYGYADVVELLAELLERGVVAFIAYAVLRLYKHSDGER